MNANRLDELRDILFQPGQEKLEELRARVEEAERRAADVAEVLPESVSASFRKDARLFGALRTPLRRCISESVREDPDEYADALFPAIGPAIRRAVAAALKAWTDQVNRAIEQSLSPRGIGWRFQAWRAGIPYGQYIMQRTLLYQVENIYLIHSASGLLVGHAAHGEAAAKDDDAISAMFTAIQEFVKDSFTKDRPQRLRTAELGELTLWAVHGPTATIVAVIRGQPPAALRIDLETALERIETEHSQALRDYVGDRDSMARLEPDLRSCLLASHREPEEHRAKKRVSPAIVILVLLAALLVGWIGYGIWMQNRVQRVAAAFAVTPGIVMTSISREGKTLTVEGLRDPLAPTPAELAAIGGWEDSIESLLRPFISLEPEFVAQRALTALAPPETVNMSLHDGTIALVGTASEQWVGTLPPLSIPGIPGVEKIDSSALVIDFSAQLERMQVIADQANMTTLAFTQDVMALEPEAQGRIQRLATSLMEYAALARRLELRPQLTVTGHSDATGEEGINVAREHERANLVTTQLNGAGVDPSWLVTRSQLEARVQGERAQQVTLRLEASASAGPIRQD